jgi:triacylglycerol lipase
MGFRGKAHGLFSYWGRIPDTLRGQGAVLYFSEHDGFGTIESNAEILRDELNAIIQDGHEKVNIIAHSRGGLEARYAAAKLGCAEKIASITTICTPHRGSRTMDFLIGIPFALSIASVFVYPFAKLLGDKRPKFKECCESFGSGYMERYNSEILDDPDVKYFSYAAVMRKPLSDIFMCLQNALTRIADGPNDGLVSVESAQWGDFGGVWKSACNRGISHMDVLDFRRKPFTSEADYDDGVYDICEAWASHVKKLKLKGL